MSCFRSTLETETSFGEFNSPGIKDFQIDVAQARYNLKIVLLVMWVYCDQYTEEVSVCYPRYKFSLAFRPE
jgi:hypothetical protein